MQNISYDCFNLRCRVVGVNLVILNNTRHIQNQQSSDLKLTILHKT